MAESITKVLLSGSTNGKGTLVWGTTSGSSVAVHTAYNSTTIIDETWVWAVNTGTNPVKLTLEWGETTVPNGNI